MSISFKLQKSKEPTISDPLPTLEDKITKMYDDAQKDIQRSVRRAIRNLHR